MRAGKYLAALYVGNELMVWAFNRNEVTRLRDTRWDLQRMPTVSKQRMPVAFDTFILAAALEASSARLIYHRACPRAGSSSASVLRRRRFRPFLLRGAAVHSDIFLFGELIRQQRRRERADRQHAAFVWAQLENGADVIGWACLCLNTVYMAIEILL